MLEDIDALAGNVAISHCEECRTPEGEIPSLVTASVDKITMARPVDLNRNVKLTGSIIWVGKSSMEIGLSLLPIDDTVPYLEAQFTYVSRNPRTGTSVPVPGLTVEGAEKQLFDQRQKAYEDRSKLRKQPNTISVLNWPSEQSIQTGLHLLKESEPLLTIPALAHRDCILIKDTRLSNALICQRQQRNVYGRIFGGFLMRRAYEIAFTTAYLFCGSQPRFLEIDEIVFKKPVNVGDLLRLDSCVLYSSQSRKTMKPEIHVEVVATVVKPEAVSSFVSNTFHFTFEKPDGGTVRRVLPSNIEEAQRVVLRMESNNRP